ncbi:response regulator [Cohnella boryungensis]|uniref:Response regulator n=1 Tax=Cohnella boryungensis TaxID=768479 RepID=A0ABV8SC79_9BACL
MLTMLVVDDEIYALKGITQGIDWSDLPIETILEAENVDQASRLLTKHRVDIVISDIEMPRANGIDLLKQIREISPDTLTIFLTGHARFEYAQEAVHYGCFDYVLKPIDHDVLKEIVRRAAEEVERRNEQHQFERSLEEYRMQWSSQLPILAERLWQEVLGGKAAIVPQRLTKEFELYDIPLTAEDSALAVLISVEQWEVELDERDERIMEYAVRKAAAEVILGSEAGAIVQDRNGLNLALLYGKNVDREGLKTRCRQYVNACRDYFHCRVSCYVGVPAPILELSEALDRLTQLERSNISSPQSVLDSTSVEESAGAASGAVQLPFAEWAITLENGQVDALIGQIEETMNRLQEEPAGREALDLFYYGFVHLLIQAASRKGQSVYDLVSGQEIEEGRMLRTPTLMQGWAAKLLNKAAPALTDRQRDTSAVIARIQAYIQDNLDKELSRDDIAGSVYRNPAYLSRLFRKETGLSLSDYIVQAKIEKVKKQLKETNDKISNIAESLGYVHFSYFAKLFKKMTGLTPQEYRKKHQSMP